MLDAGVSVSKSQNTALAVTKGFISGLLGPLANGGRPGIWKIAIKTVLCALPYFFSVR